LVWSTAACSTLGVAVIASASSTARIAASLYE